MHAHTQHPHAHTHAHVHAKFACGMRAACSSQHAQRSGAWCMANALCCKSHAHAAPKAYLEKLSSPPEKSKSVQKGGFLRKIKKRTKKRLKKRRPLGFWLP